METPAPTPARRGRPSKMETPAPTPAMRGRKPKAEPPMPMPTPAKRGRKPKVEAPAEIKGKIKRGRKPKVQAPAEIPAKAPARRGRPSLPKGAKSQEVSLNSLTKFANSIVAFCVENGIADPNLDDVRAILNILDKGKALKFEKGGKISRSGKYISKWQIKQILTDGGMKIGSDELLSGVWLKKKGRDVAQMRMGGKIGYFVINDDILESGKSVMLGTRRISAKNRKFQGVFEGKMVGGLMKVYDYDDEMWKVVNPDEWQQAYAEGGGVGFFDALPFGGEVAFETEGDYELEIDDFEDKLKTIHNQIKFDEVYGETDNYETALEFYKNGEKVASLKGTYNENSDTYDSEFLIDGYSSYINFHPFGTLGGLDLGEFNSMVENAVAESQTYSAVVSIEGYEVDGQEFKNKQNAEIGIEELKEKTNFYLVRGKRFGQGKRVENEKILRKYQNGGGVGERNNYAEGGGVGDTFSMSKMIKDNGKFIEMVIAENVSVAEFEKLYSDKGYEKRFDVSLVGFHFANPNGDTIQLIPSFHKRGEIISYAKGGEVGFTEQFTQVEDFGYESFYIRKWGKVETNKKEVELLVVASIRDLEDFISEDEMPEEGSFQLNITLIPFEKHISKKHKTRANDESNAISNNTLVNVVNYMGGLNYNPQEQFIFKTFDEAQNYLMSKELNDKISAEARLSGFVMDRPYNRVGQKNWEMLEYIVGERQMFAKGGGVENFTLADYKENEQINNHSENALMLTKMYGTQGEINEVERLIKKGEREGDSEVDWRRIYEISGKYYKHLVEASKRK